jgi:hypothetical protein
MKKIVKKTASKKPMMKSGGAKKLLRRYQGNEGGSEVKAPSQRTFAQAYQENLDAGIRPGQAKRIAMVETGVKEQKKRIDPNAIINAVGNTANAAGSLINAVKPNRSSSSSDSMGFQKRGGSTKKTILKKSTMKMKKGGVAKIKSGGAKKSLSKVQMGGPKKAENKVIKKLELQLPRPSDSYKVSKLKDAPTLDMEQNYGVAGKYGPKTESDTKTINWINSVGKRPEKPIPFQRKGGATKPKMAKGGTKYSANNTGATYQMGYKKGGTVSKTVKAKVSSIKKRNGKK